MIDIDMEETRQLVIIVNDGHRTTITVAHPEGIELYRKINEYYGRLEYGAGTDELPTKKGLFERLKKRFFTPSAEETP